MVRRTTAVVLTLIAVPSAAQAQGDTARRSLDRVDRIARSMPGHVTKSTSHRPGMVARRVLAAAAPTGGPSLPTTWCGDETSLDNAGVAANAFQPERPAIKVVYAYPSDRTSDFARQADVIQESVAMVDRYMARATNNQKTLRFDMGTRCGPEYVDIQVLKLPRTQADYVDGTNAFGKANFSEVAADAVRAVNYDKRSGYRSIAIWMDYTADEACCGWGTARIGGANPAVSYQSSYYQSREFLRGRAPAAALFLGYGMDTAEMPSPEPQLLLHEISHSLGAVPEDSPHATVNHHCWQDWDLMCYDDGTLPAGQEMVTDCPFDGGVLGFFDYAYDCGNDDYFRPQAGTGKGMGINVYDNLMLQPCSEQVAACDGQSAPLPDRDGDGLADAYDLCPSASGKASAHGCPYRSGGTVNIPVAGNRTVNGSIRGTLSGTLATFTISSRRLPAGTWTLVGCVREEMGDQDTEGPSGPGCYGRTVSLKKPGPASYTGRVRMATEFTGVRFSGAMRDSRRRVLSRTPSNLGIGEVDALY